MSRQLSASIQDCSRCHSGTGASLASTASPSARTARRHRQPNRVAWLLAISLAVVTGVDRLAAQCAPNSPQGGTGPDVIVGELQGSIRSYGSSGNYYGYSIGTTSCNIGTQQLDWISFNSNHPVIAQNLYRYKDGRFEQIAMSWLKQGFTALQQNACGCGCISSGTGARLGIGCSDPYSADLNGSQFPNALSSRSEVTAPHAGTFQYPPSLQPSVTDQTSRRLRAHVDDINPNSNAGARYYAEAQYVTPDDAAAGNAYNNTSYRRVAFGVNPTTFPMLFAGPTVRQKTAIEAWPLEDPSAILMDVFTGESPEPGRLVVGYSVSDNQDGTFRYEYAIFNQNSTRGVQAFEVPISSLVPLRDTGFGDVEYHSGDPYSSADWSITVDATSIRWASQTEAQNPNANALRWGSLYNFWFTSPASPVAVTASVDYFRMNGFAGDATGTTVPLQSPGDTVVTPIAGLVCANGGNGVSLTWSLDPAHTAVEVFRDGQLLATLPEGATSYQDLAATPGDRIYTVRGRQGAAFSSAAPCGLNVPARSDKRFDLAATSVTAGYDELTGVGSFSIDVSLVEDAGNADFPNLTAGYSIALTNDPTLLTATSVQLGTAASALNGGTGPSFFLPSLAAEGVTAAVVYSFSSTAFLTAETPIELLSISYDTNPASLSGNAAGLTTVIGFMSGQLGVPPVDNVVVISPGVSQAPGFSDAIVTLDPGFEEFRRGDCNIDGDFDIADPIFLLSTLFPRGTPLTIGCEDACDGNDDGSIDIADAVRLLGALFGSPTLPLPTPSAGCGTDPSRDGLDCANNSACTP